MPRMKVHGTGIRGVITSLLVCLNTVVYSYKITPIFPASNRTNFCGRAQAVLNNSLSLYKSLTGMKGKINPTFSRTNMCHLQLTLAISISVTVAIHELTPNFYTNVSGNTGQPTKGFMYYIQNQIASRGGFKFQYVLVPGLPTGMSWTGRLPQILSHLDLYGNNWYSDTIDRRQARIGFTQSIVDASLVLITVETIDKTETTFWSFLKPFTFELWAVIVAVVIFNGIFHWIIDPHEGLSLFRSVYLSIGTLTAVEGMAPEKALGSILNIGYSFFALITIATYTANLASTLITAQKPSVQVSSIDDANNRGLAICALSGSNALSVIQTSYPKIDAISIQSNSIPVMFDAMRTGSCVGSVITQADWDVAQVQSAANPYCNLVSVGGSIRFISGSWPYLMDYSSYCTSFAADVIGDILVGMKADGSFQDAWSSAITAATTINCPEVLAVDNGPQQMDIINLSGVIFVYVSSVGLVLLWWVLKQIETWLKDNNRWPTALTALSKVTKFRGTSPDVVKIEDIYDDNDDGNFDRNISPVKPGGRRGRRSATRRKMRQQGTRNGGGRDDGEGESGEEKNAKNQRLCDSILISDIDPQIAV